MPRISVSLPHELAEALAREARRRNVPEAAIIRDALAGHLGPPAGEPRVVPFSALGRSGHRDTARAMTELLADEWDEARRR
jgi:hypothetical protein